MSPELFVLVGEGITGILYFLIVPVSLLFFAIMTPEFRKMMRVHMLVVAFIGILMLVPLYETISYAFLPPDVMITDVTTGFIVLILIGFFGIPSPTIFGLVMGSPLSKRIQFELSDSS